MSRLSIRFRDVDRNGRSAAGPLTVALLTFVAFLPGLFGQFLSWDDDRNFLVNPFYRGLGWAQLRWMLTTTHMGPYAPVTWLTLGADYVVWGMNPVGYHLTALLFHAANALLFFLVARRLLAAALPAASWIARELGAAAAALLFAVHPLRVESVVWITERRDVVSGFFFLLSVLAYLRAAGREQEAQPSMRWTAASLGLFAAAILSKPIVVTLPALLLVLDVYPLRRLGGAAGWTTPAARRVLLEKAPFLVLSGAGIVGAFAGLAQVGNMASLRTVGLADRVAISLHGLAFYLGKTLWPVSLSHLYEMPFDIRILSGPVLASAALVVTGAGAAVIWRRRCPGLAAAGLAYVIALSPVLGLFQNGPQMAADRYTYLACLGWALLAGGLTARLAGRALETPRAPWAPGALVAVAIALVTLVALSARQSLVWHDSVTLWEHAVRVDPSGARARTGLALHLLRAGRVPEATSQLEAAIRLNPAVPEALMSLAIARSVAGRLDEALVAAGRAVAAKPHDAGFHFHFGEMLRAAGKSGEALAAFVESRRLEPSAPTTHYAIAVVLAEQGRAAEALAALEEGHRRARALALPAVEQTRYEALVLTEIDPERAVAAWRRYRAAAEAASTPEAVRAGRLAEADAALARLRESAR